MVPPAPSLPGYVPFLSLQQRETLPERLQKDGARHLRVSPAICRLVVKASASIAEDSVFDSRFGLGDFPVMPVT